MKKQMIETTYHAFIMNKKQLILYSFSFLLSIILFFSLSFKIGVSIKLPYASFKSILAEAVPLTNNSEAQTSRILIRNEVIRFLTGFDFKTKQSYIASIGGIFSVVTPHTENTESNPPSSLIFDFSENNNTKEANNTDAQQKTTTAASAQGNNKIINITSIKGNNKYYTPTSNIAIKNDTTLPVDGPSLLNAPVKINMKTGGPKVLIIHTHTTEAYAPCGITGINSSFNGRSLNPSENVTAVGDKVCEILNKNGIKTIHDTRIHDYPNFIHAYNNCLKDIQEDLKKNPTIEMVIDIHRDAVVMSNGSPVKYTTEINGKTVSQVMLVLGSFQGGLPHPNWQENLKLAFKIQKKMDDQYPTLARPINVRKERFNEHATIGSMIMEVGTHVNTLDEAIGGASYAAECISEVLNGLK